MNNKIRTLLIDDDDVIINDVKKYFSSSTVVEVNHIAKDGNEALKIAVENKDSIDLVIMDTLLPGKDGFTLLNDFKSLGSKFKIILTSSMKNELLFNNIDNFNVEYIMLKPYSMRDLENIISSVFNGDVKNLLNNRLEPKISKMLHSLGIPSHIKGYQ